MSAEELIIFKEDILNKAHVRLDDAESPGDFLATLDIITADAESFLRQEWTFGTEVPELIATKTGGALPPGAEGENAIKVFEYLGDMTGVEASDRRLWTYLSTVTFADYTRLRWPLDGDSWKNRARTRWLMANGNRAQLVRNSVSRLWWAAKLTHDPQYRLPLSREKNDPYAYLRAAIEKEDRFLAIFDRDTGMVPALRIALIEHFLKKTEYQHERYVRDFMKEVILVTGYRELAGLSFGQIHDILESISSRLDRTLVDA